MMPAGTVISYTGTLTNFTTTSPAEGTINLIHKNGWALCNGAILEKASYVDLTTRLGTTWNSCSETLTGAAMAAISNATLNFRIPNLQGVFLRGVADYAGTNAYNTANDVALGIYKPDQSQGHIHGISQYYATFQTGSAANVLGTGAASINQSTIGVPTDDGTNGTPRTGFETAPKQVGIYYLVKLYDNLAAADVYIPPASASVDGIVDRSAQTFAGVKTFNAGISLPTSGGTASNLDYYETGTFPANFNVGLSTNSNVITVSFVRVGKAVTLYIPQLITTATATVATSSTATGTIPTRLLPALIHRNYNLTTFNNNTPDENVRTYLLIYATGVLEAVRTSNWTSGTGNCGFYGTMISYMIA
jgi:microcystin-dependent protein